MEKNSSVSFIKLISMTFRWNVRRTRILAPSEEIYGWWRIMYFCQNFSF